MTEPRRIGPCSLKQKVFLQAKEDIVLGGGSAGAGKSYLALLKALKLCLADPAARVGIIRLSYPMLKGVGGLVDESKQLFREFGAVWKQQPLEWVFPNGAIAKFMALPDDLSELQGLQFTTIIVDEGAEFTQEAILALKARLRGARYKGDIGMIISCNPNRHSFLFSWIEWCLDPETGIPKPGTEDVVKYFVMLNNKLHWGDSVEELYEKHGLGFTLGVDFIPTSFRYVPMTIYDNPVLLKSNPGYLANLLSMSRVNQLRFLKGSWTAVTEGSSVFNRAWIRFVDEPPVNPVSKVRSWDLAYSVPSEANKNVDWTAGTLMSRTKEGTYCIEHVERFQKLTDGVIKTIVDTAQHRDGTDILVTIPKDNGGGKAASALFLRMFAEEGLYVRGITQTNQVSKMKRFLPFCTLAESGAVTMVKGDWNEDFLCELERFDGTRLVHDDMVDATSDAFLTLAKQTVIPTFTLTTFTGTSPIPQI